MFRRCFTQYFSGQVDFSGFRWVFHRMFWTTVPCSCSYLSSHFGCSASKKSDDLHRRMFGWSNASGSCFFSFSFFLQFQLEPEAWSILQQVYCPTWNQHLGKLPYSVYKFCFWWVLLCDLSGSIGGCLYCSKDCSFGYLPEAAVHGSDFCPHTSRVKSFDSFIFVSKNELPGRKIGTLADFGIWVPDQNHYIDLFAVSDGIFWLFIENFHVFIFVQRSWRITLNESNFFTSVLQFDEQRWSLTARWLRFAVILF